MKKIFLLGFIIPGIIFSLKAQLPVVISKNFSMGGYGRVGIARADKVQFPRSLNLNGMGSIGGRMEENDYVEMISAFNFEPVSGVSDTTKITIQSRIALYTTQGQIIGNVNSNAYGGLTIALPELFAEAKNIMGSQWSAWVGARLFRGDDIHLIDHFYFDDHSSQGFGIQYKNTRFSIMYPGAADSTSSLPPYFYLNIVNGTPVLGLRNRSVYILEQTVPVKEGSIKLMAEYQRLASGSLSDTSTGLNYPSDFGYVFRS
jgi:maltoporin